MPRPGATILNIQLLRAVAALGVAYSHVASDAGLNLPFVGGTSGVDVFFVISGFIISWIAEADPAQFLLKRLIRIVPAYWAATLAMFAVTLLLPAYIRRAAPDAGLLVSSLLFVPHHTASGLSPTLVQGWTLNYEMYFYVLFAIALAVAKRHAVWLCSGFILAAMAAVDLLPIGPPEVLFYGSSIVVEFVFGMLIYQVFRAPRGWFAGPGRRGDAVFWACIASAAAGFLVLPLPELTGLPRLPLAGGAAAVIVASFLLLEMRYGFASRNRIVLLLGEASYIVYLIHPFVFYGFTRLAFPRAAAWPMPAKWLLATALLATVAALASGLHIWLEKPVLSALRRRFLRPKAMIAQPAMEIGTR